MPHRPYLPVSSQVVNDTQFPLAEGKDLQTDIGLIEECWRVNYTEIIYRSINKKPTPADPLQNELSGEAGTTQFDPVWREQVPSSMEPTGWEQPHGEDVDVHDATDRGVFFVPQKVHARIEGGRERERALKKYGFDKIRDLVVVIPLSLLDACDIHVTPDDFFVWDDDEYVVKQHRRTGFWKNSNIRLYIALNCEHRKLGA